MKNKSKDISEEYPCFTAWRRSYCTSGSRLRTGVREVSRREDRGMSSSRTNWKGDGRCVMGMCWIRVSRYHEVDVGNSSREGDSGVEVRVRHWRQGTCARRQEEDGRFGHAGRTGSTAILHTTRFFYARRRDSTREHYEYEERRILCCIESKGISVLETTQHVP